MNNLEKIIKIDFKKTIIIEVHLTNDKFKWRLKTKQNKVKKNNLLLNLFTTDTKYKNLKKKI
jgi:hypothetical protein